MTEARTYSTEGPQCPHCGFTFTPDESYYFDESRYTEETCQDCNRRFTVEVNNTTSWRCVLLPADPIEAQAPDAHGTEDSGTVK